MQIEPTTQPARYLIQTLAIEGLTELGQLTGIRTTLDADTIWGEGDAEFLANAQGNVTDYDPIPAVGEWCEADKMYGYNSGIVICRQAHTRLDYTPEETPALWLFYQEEASDWEWIAGEQVYIGTQRLYSEVLYECIQAHVTQVGWEPPNVPALWSAVSTTDEWAAGVAYSVDDVVTYLGVEYICIQAHTSQVGWEPPNVPALWELV